MQSFDASPFPLSEHALEQMSRRRIRARDIELAMTLGQEVHAAGALFYVLRKRDIPRDLRGDANVRRAEGTTVVIEHDRISTVYRNRSVGHLRRKSKRSARPVSDRSAQRRRGSISRTSA